VSDVRKVVGRCMRAWEVHAIGLIFCSVAKITRVFYMRRHPHISDGMNKFHCSKPHDWY
jgi:hypothetical protein